MSEMDSKGLKARDLLLIPQLRAARLLAGSSGLDYNITRVNVMEVPDIINWVRPGEFLMTTGYPFRKRLEALEELIPQLAEKGIAAFGIKTKRFIDEVPMKVIEAADRYGLPLIELPPDTTFSDVVREVMERVLIKEARQLSILQNRIQELAQVLLYGGGLSKFMRHLEQVVNNPVVLLGSNNQLIMSSGAEELERLASTTIDWRRFREDTSLGLSYLEMEYRTVRVYVSEIPDRREPSSLLLLLEVRQEYGLIDTLTMDRTGELVGFEIMNTETRREIEAKYIDQFLQDWLAGRMPASGDLRLRGEACGSPLNENDHYRVGIIRFTEGQPEMKELQLTVKWLRWKGMEGFRCTVTEEGLVVLLSSPAGTQICEAEALQLLRLSIPKLTYNLCFGSIVSDANEVPQSYQQAKRTLDLSGTGLVIYGKSERTEIKQASVKKRKNGFLKAFEPSDNTALYYEDLGIYLLLYMLPNCKEVEEFKEKFLYPLQKYDNKHQSALIDTLRMYYSVGGNMRAAAERLFTHHNTISYRLERVQEVLGLSLENPEISLQLQVALRLNDIAR